MSNLPSVDIDDDKAIESIINSPQVYEHNGDVIEFDMEREKPIRLPAQIKRLHGCLHCEWKKTEDCPYLRADKLPSSKICSKRASFLGNFVRDLVPKKGFSNTLTYKDWQNLVMDAYGMTQAMKDSYRYNKAQDKVKELTMLHDELSGTDNVDIDKLKHIKSQLTDAKMDMKDARIEWESLFDKIVKNNQNYMRITQPKKMEMTIEKLGITNINRIIAGEFNDDSDNDVIDAEFKEVMGD